MSDKLSFKDVTKLRWALDEVIEKYREVKPNDRSLIDRAFAVLLTDLEKVQAYHMVHIEWPVRRADQGDDHSRIIFDEILDIGGKIKKIRGEFGYSLRDVEKQTGVSASTLSRIERADITANITLQSLLSCLDWIKGFEGPTNGENVDQ